MFLLHLTIYLLEINSPINFTYQMIITFISLPIINILHKHLFSCLICYFFENNRQFIVGYFFYHF
jgi:hypothetical protein